MTSTEDSRIDPATVAALYAEHAESLRAFLCGVLRDADAAAEALQATFVRAMESGQTAHEETRKGWLFRVAFNEAMQIKRRRTIDDRSRSKLAWQTKRPDSEPDEGLIRDEVIQRVREGLDSLPPEQRQVVCLRIYEEKTFAVIAEELGVPLGTVLTRMRLATKRLARRLRNE